MCISKILSYFAGETKKENVNLVIDIGNTVAKLAVFDGDKVVDGEIRTEKLNSGMISRKAHAKMHLISRKSY